MVRCNRHHPRKRPTLRRKHPEHTETTQIREHASPLSLTLAFVQVSAGIARGGFSWFYITVFRNGDTGYGGGGGGTVAVYGTEMLPVFEMPALFV